MTRDDETVETYSGLSMMVHDPTGILQYMIHVPSPAGRTWPGRSWVFPVVNVQHVTGAAARSPSQAQTQPKAP
jgi:hypothetical protein